MAFSLPSHRRLRLLKVQSCDKTPVLYGYLWYIYGFSAFFCIHFWTLFWFSLWGGVASVYKLPAHRYCSTGFLGGCAAELELDLAVPRWRRIFRQSGACRAYWKQQQRRRRRRRRRRQQQQQQQHDPWCLYIYIIYIYIKLSTAAGRA